MIISREAVSCRAVHSYLAFWHLKLIILVIESPYYPLGNTSDSSVKLGL